MINLLDGPPSASSEAQATLSFENPSGPCETHSGFSRTVLAVGGIPHGVFEHGDHLLDLFHAFFTCRLIRSVLEVAVEGQVSCQSRGDEVGSGAMIER